MDAVIAEQDDWGETLIKPEGAVGGFAARGEVVYASDRYPQGLTIWEYLALAKPARRHCEFRAMIADPLTRINQS